MKLLRKLATIREIKEIKPIPGADKIEVAVVDGWECVVKKDENFHTGDMVIYIEIDSIMPKKPEFEFLAERKYRIKTIKLRKQVSQGLVLPLSFLPSTKYKLNDDVTKILGITKYDTELEQEMKIANDTKVNPIIKYLLRFNFFRKLYNKYRGTRIRKGNFPSWIVKTDEERIQNLPDLFEQLKRDKIELVATEKIDGTSSTYFYRNSEFGICSRNMKLDKDTKCYFKGKSPYYEIANQLNIETVLKSIAKEFHKEAVVLQGEIIGEGIQGNKYHIDGYQFRAFNLILNGKKLDQIEMQSILEPYDIKCVDTVNAHLKLEGELTETPFKYAKGKSLLLKTQNREGIVLRNYDRGISFKIINPEFLLEEA